LILNEEVVAENLLFGGGGRNRTRPAFHKPLEINGLNHHRCLDTKGVCDLIQVNSSRLLLAPFYSPASSYWRWPERDLAGNTIDFHVRVLGLSFHDAMRQITST
jgi:hypothetical protein